MESRLPSWEDVEGNASTVNGCFIKTKMFQYNDFNENDFNDDDLVMKSLTQQPHNQDTQAGPHSFVLKSGSRKEEKGDKEPSF